MASDGNTAAERLRFALELFQDAEDMVRAKVRRERPDATDEEIEAAIGAWLAPHPGAEQGDYSDGSDENDPR